MANIVDRRSFVADHRGVSYPNVGLLSYTAARENDGFGAGVGVADPVAAATAATEEGGLLRVFDLAGSGDRLRASNQSAVQHMAAAATRRIRGRQRAGHEGGRRGRHAASSDAACPGRSIAREEKFVEKERLGKPQLRRSDHASDHQRARAAAHSFADLRVDGPERILL